MKIIEYKEQKKRGRTEFPVEYHHVTPNHPRYAMPHHWHEELEVIRILEGTFNLTLDEHEITASAGDYIIINGGTLHGGVPDHCIYDCAVLDYDALFKGNTLFQNTLEPLRGHRVKLKETLPGDDTEVRDLLSDLFRNLSVRDPGYEFRVIGLLSILTGHFLEKKYYDEAVRNTGAVDRIQSIKKVLDYIEQHYSEPVSLSELSAVSGMSPKYFCRFFREMTYKTPIDYLNYYRIEVAGIKLLSENASVTEVAFSCGFNELNYFIRCFKKYKGVSPKKYQLRPFKKEAGA